MSPVPETRRSRRFQEERCSAGQWEVLGPQRSFRHWSARGHVVLKESEREARQEGLGTRGFRSRGFRHALACLGSVNAAWLGLLKKVFFLLQICCFLFGEIGGGVADGTRSNRTAIARRRIFRPMTMV